MFPWLPLWQAKPRPPSGNTLIPSERLLSDTLIWFAETWKLAGANRSTSFSRHASTGREPGSGFQAGIRTTRSSHGFLIHTVNLEAWTRLRR